MSESKMTRIDYLYNNFTNSNTEDELFGALHKFLNYLDENGFYSELSKEKLIEISRIKKNSKSWTRKVAQILGQILKGIKIYCKYSKKEPPKFDYEDTIVQIFGPNFNHINLNIPIKFKKISIGGTHTLFLDYSGKVYTIGKNSFGQLGLGSDVDQASQITQIESLSNVSQIFSGYAYSFAISDGMIYSWGAGDNGRLGLGDTSNKDIPIKIETDVKFKSVAGGSTMACALSVDNKIYSWGDKYPNGHNEDFDCLAPKIIKIFENRLFQQICVGTGSYHTIALSASGKIFTWGHNRCGQLGLGHNNGIEVMKDEYYIRIPQLVKSCICYDKRMDITNFNIVKITSGWGHSIFLTDSGKVFTCGRNFKGQLGHSFNSSVTNSQGIKYIPYFKNIESLENFEINSISAGYETSEFLTNDQLIVFGDGKIINSIQKDLEALGNQFNINNVLSIDSGSDNLILVRGV